MKISADYIIVGSGLTGATIARILADEGREVVVLERRPTVGGNVVDHVHPSGIRVHTYGPHHFRCESDQMWAFVNRFTSFYRYDWWVMSDIDGQLEHWPVQQNYVDGMFGKDWKPSFTGTPANFEEACLAMMPAYVYEKFIKGYSEKQWGKPATQLSAGMAGRFQINPKGEIRLKTHKYQGLPTNGYTAMMENMLAGIPVLTSTDYDDVRGDLDPRVKLIYTGPIDAFFGYALGKLQYRGQIRETIYHPYQIGYAQTAPAINSPSPKVKHVRALEWKRMMNKEFAAKIKGTLITTETPYTPTEVDQFEYPYPDEANAALAAEYKRLAAELPKVYICGRLGEYRYYDMDQAIARAMMHAGKLLGKDASEVMRQTTMDVTFKEK